MIRVNLDQQTKVLLLRVCCCCNCNSITDPSLVLFCFMIYFVSSYIWPNISITSQPSSPNCTSIARFTPIWLIILYCSSIWCFVFNQSFLHAFHSLQISSKRKWSICIVCRKIQGQMALKLCKFYSLLFRALYKTESSAQHKHSIRSFNYDKYLWT